MTVLQLGQGTEFNPDIVQALIHTSVILSLLLCTHTHTHTHKHTCAHTCSQTLQDLYSLILVTVKKNFFFSTKSFYIVTTPEVTYPHRTKTSNQEPRFIFIGISYITVLMQDFFFRYKLSMLRMYTYYTLNYYIVYFFNQN